MKSRTLRFVRTHRLSIALENEKGRQAAASVSPETGRVSKSRRARAGHGHRLAGLDHVSRLGGLAVIDVGAGCDPEAGDQNTGNQRHHHDLQVGSHDQPSELSGSYEPPDGLSRRLWAHVLRTICFRMVSRVPQNGFINPPARFRRAGGTDGSGRPPGRYRPGSNGPPRRTAGRPSVVVTAAESRE